MISLTPLTPLVLMNMSSVTASQKNEQKQILVIIKPLILVARGVLAHLGLEVGLEHIMYIKGGCSKVRPPVGF